MTGQIPLVPDSVTDLDLVVPPGLQALLPILKYRANSLDSIDASHQEALRRFNAEGAAGVKRRYEFVRDHHSLGARLDAFARFMRSQHCFQVAGEGGQAVWRNWA